MMNRENFNKWNEIKKEISNKDNFLLIHEREIWWSSLSLNIGDEEGGRGEAFERPILIFKKFNNRVCLILPLTSKKGNPKFYFKINYDNKINFVILSQIRLISIKRLKRIIAVLSPDQFIKLKNSFGRLIQ